MGRFIVVWSMLIVMLAGSWVAAQVGPTNLKRGQALYEGHCAGCHGQNGDGLGPDAQYLVVPPANFKSTRTTTKTDGKLLMSNSNGVLFSPMHAWRDRLSEQEMKDIIDYLRMLSPFNPIS